MPIAVVKLGLAVLMMAGVANLAGCAGSRARTHEPATAYYRIDQEPARVDGKVATSRPMPAPLAVPSHEEQVSAVVPAPTRPAPNAKQVISEEQRKALYSYPQTHDQQQSNASESRRTFSQSLASMNPWTGKSTSPEVQPEQRNETTPAPGLFSKVTDNFRALR